MSLSAAGETQALRLAITSEFKSPRAMADPTKNDAGVQAWRGRRSLAFTPLFLVKTALQDPIFKSAAMPFPLDMHLKVDLSDCGLQGKTRIAHPRAPTCDR